MNAKGIMNTLIMETGVLVAQQPAEQASHKTYNTIKLINQAIGTLMANALMPSLMKFIAILCELND